MNTWTTEEIEILKANYASATNARLSELIPNKSPYAIYKKAYKMGLRKTPEIEFLNRSIANSGEKCNFWKGGKKTSSSGYRLILKPGHHRADRGGYVLEHILVFEEATGISIPDGCCIHHMNGIKDDNRIENLCMMTHGAHTVMHHTGAKRTAETKRKISERKRKYVT